MTSTPLNTDAFTPFQPTHHIHDTRWYNFCQKTYYLPILNGEYAQCRYAPQAHVDDIYAWQIKQRWFYISSGMKLLQTMSGLYTNHQDPHHDLMLDIMRQRLNQKKIMPSPIQVCQAVDDDAMGNLPAFHLYAPRYGIDNYIWASQSDFYDLLGACITAPANALNMGNIALDLQIRLGSSTIFYQQYKKLTVGDLLLVQKARFNLDGVGSKPLGAMAMGLRYDDALYFTSWEHNTMPNDDDTNYDHPQNDDENHDEETTDDETQAIQNEVENEYHDEANHDETDEEDTYEVIENDDVEKFAPPDKEDKHPFADIPVQLDFSLGTLNMTVAQVSELAENALLPLQAPLDGQAQVAIYANKRLIAYGEIVSIAEQLGVRITRIPS